MPLRAIGTRLLCLAGLLTTGCPTYSVQQSSFVPLPTAPAAAPLSGRGAIELGSSFATEVTSSASTGATSGLGTPLAQPEGALSVRLTDYLLLRAYGGVALSPGGWQVSGDVPLPDQSGGFGGVGPVLRLLGWNGILFADFSVTGGFAVIPSRLWITEHNWCSDPTIECPASSRQEIRFEVLPLFTVGGEVGLRPAEWLQVRLGALVRNQPTNEAAFSSGTTAGSSISAGPIGLVLHAGLQLDVTEEIGLRADVQWPAVNFAMTYGPIITVGVQGRLGAPDRAHPTGLQL